MRPTNTTLFYRVLIVTLALAAFGADVLFAQATLTVSRHADFSTSDRRFETGDMLYLRAAARNVDATAVEESTYEIEPSGPGTALRGTLRNHLDGTFTADVAAAALDGRSGVWKVKVRLRDHAGRTFEARTLVTVHTPGTPAEVFRLHGVVEAASATEVTIAGQVVHVDERTRVVIPGDADPQAAELQGETVMAVVRRDAGALVAVEIVAVSTRPGEIEVVGLVRARTDTSLVVHGITFAVDANTQFSGRDGGPIRFADLPAGTFVTVRARRTDDGWLATSVSVEDRGRDRAHKVEGVVTEVGVTTGEEGRGGFVRVDSLTFVVNERTVFEDVSGLLALTVGTRVEVHFVDDGQGTFFALKLEVEDEDSGDGFREVEVEGVLTEVATASVSVDSLSFQVDSSVGIVGRRGEPLRLADLATGMTVEVKGYYDNGVLVATRIKVEDEGNDELELVGAVTARGDSSLTIGRTTVHLSEATVITDGTGATLTLDDIEMGSIAHVTVVVGADGTLTALRITVRGQLDRYRVEVTGLLRAVSATELVVGHHTFVVDAATEVFGKDGEPIDIGALAAGQVVRVEGARQADGTVLAVEVRVRSNGHRDGEVRGPVTALEGDTLVVAGIRISLSTQTVYRGVDGPAGLQVGQLVKVHYREMPDGQRLALRVAADVPEPERRIVLRGTIEAVESDVVVVAGTRVTVTGATTIAGRGGAALTLADLEAGQTVKVHAATTGGTLEAVRIQVKEAVTVVASVETHAGGRLTVAGETYVVTDETLVVGRDNEPLDVNAVYGGLMVEVFAVESDAADGTMVAERIAITDVVTLTGVEAPAGADVPAGFVLHQNFPNPFNPVTTIAFELVEPAPATLVVFDVLGRRVRALATGVHTPGRYTYTWDGRDEAGRPVASGTYLYRLQVGDRVTSRTMTLVK